MERDQTNAAIKQQLSTGVDQQPKVVQVNQPVSPKPFYFHFFFIPNTTYQTWLDFSFSKMGVTQYEKEKDLSFSFTGDGQNAELNCLSFCMNFDQEYPYLIIYEQFLRISILLFNFDQEYQYFSLSYSRQR